MHMRNRRMYYPCTGWDWYAQWLVESFACFQLLRITIPPPSFAFKCNFLLCNIFLTNNKWKAFVAVFVANGIVFPWGINVWISCEKWVTVWYLIKLHIPSLFKINMNWILSISNYFRKIRKSINGAQGKYIKSYLLLSDTLSELFKYIWTLLGIYRNIFEIYCHFPQRFLSSLQPLEIANLFTYNISPLLYNI